MRGLLLVALCIALSSPAFAGAWTQAKGHAQLIVTNLYYSTDELFNNNGRKTSQSTYRKYELNPYFEYGLNDNITLGANLSFQRAMQETIPSQANWGIGDSEFFLRAKLWQRKGLVISAEPMIKLPSPEHGYESPTLGGRNMDAGLGMSVGYGFSLLGQNHFANLDAQYRARLGAPEDQVKLAATLGIGITPRLMIMPQAFATLRAKEPAVVNFTQSSGDDYDLLKLQVSAVYQWRSSVSIQAGAFSHVDGKNVGAGEGVILSLWKKF